MTTDITLLDDVEVKLVEQSGDDATVVRAARVSVQGENEIPEEILSGKDEGLIKYLVREKHGSPFEHNMFTFYIKAPIFVFREFHRHRVGWSYNEMSGRYTELPPEFYIPKLDRPLQNVGKPSKPEFAPGTNLQTRLLKSLATYSYKVSWKVYKTLLRVGVANEVARIVLPVGIYSQMYATANARSIMNFLALRTKDERARHLSRPQHEIELVARQIEEQFAQKFPVTYQAFNDNGRVAP